MSNNGTGRIRNLPGFRHILEASLLFGAIGGLTDVSYIFTRNPDLIADPVAGLRFVFAGGFLTSVAYLLYLFFVLIFLRPVSSWRKWPLEFSLGILYGLAVLPAGVIVARNYATLLGEESLLVAQVKVFYYFLKYMWVVVPVSWAVGIWLGRLRATVGLPLLFARFSAVLISAGVYLLITPLWQQRMLLARAKVFSEVVSNQENLIISALVFAIAVVLLPVLLWLFGRLVKIRAGAILSILWLVGIVVPFIPPLLVGPPLVGTPPSGVELAGRPSNVILVSLDTTRYDDLGFNGSEVVSTPNFDQIAANGIVFDNAITPMPMTGPAHISMLTGLQPDSDIGHGVKSNGIPLDEDVPTLATILDESGYNTGAIIAGFPLVRQASGIERGFHHYHDIFDPGLRSRFLPDQIWYLTVMKIIRKVFDIKEGLPHGKRKSADDVTDQALEWLETNSDDPFFLFIHYFDPHYLYAPPAPFNNLYMPDYNGPYKDRAVSLMDLFPQIPSFTEDDFDYYRSLYRGEISFMDQEFGRLVDWGNENNLWDNTQLIIVADHGESFEHDYYYNHTDRVYDQLVHVPLVVMDPDASDAGSAGSRVDDLVNVSDIFFTVLNFLEIDPPASVASMHDGVFGIDSSWDHDLTSLFPGESDGGLETLDDPDENDSGWQFVAIQSYSFAVPGEPSMGRFFCFRFPDWKIIYGPDAEPQLPAYQYFDLFDDPDEMTDLYPDIDWPQHEWDGISEVLELWTSRQAAMDLSTLDPRVREELKALGYIQEGGQ